MNSKLGYPQKMKNTRHSKLKLTLVGACLGALIAGTPTARAQEAAPPTAKKLKQLENENEDLRKRLDALEGILQKEGLAPSCDKGDSGSPAVKALSDITLSGFVTASYFYDGSSPKDGSPNAYLWNRSHDSFTLNKFKLVLASPPAAKSGDTFSAGYRASLIFGEDSPIVDTGLGVPGFGNIREAYVDLNVPIGTGLNIKAGQLISLLNYESGDGGSANANFSQGNQWFFTGNGPGAGVQASYDLTDKMTATFRVQNGLYAGAKDNNGYKTFLGSLAFKPTPDIWFNLIGFGGRGDVVPGEWLKGGSVIGGVKVAKVTLGTELDYFSTDLAGGGDSAAYSAGLWVSTDLTDKVGVALRGDYITDKDGFFTAGLLGLPVGGGTDLASITLTLNWKPVPNVKVQPEIRYDHASRAGDFDGHENRFIFGAGISYLF
jgi:hypothetical protein